MRHVRASGRALLLLALLAAPGCARRGASEEAGGEAEHAADAVVSVRVVTLEARTFESAVTAPGQWRSAGELVISAPFAGLVDSLGPRIGDRVRAGERLGTLITRESWSALQGAELMAHEARDAAARAEAARALELARHDLVHVPIVAREGGMVLRRALEPGAQVSESGEILALLPARNVVFEAHVPSADGARLKLGQRAIVNEQGGGSRETTVQRILPTTGGADQSLVVWLASRGEGDPAALDRYGTASILVGSPHRGLGAPDSAVVEDDLTGERRLAVVGQDGRITWTAVRLGAAEDGLHEILGASLTPGARVVVEGQRGLPDGAHVKWTP